MKGLENSKLIFRLDNEYKHFFRKIISEEIKRVKVLPITWEDVYYEFLFKSIDFVNKFDESKKVPFSNYIALKCKNFTRNKIKHFLTNKHKIMNFSVNDIYLLESYSGLMDSIDTSHEKVDISKLSKEEFVVYKSIYVDSNSKQETARKLGISIYDLRKTLERIKTKIGSQLKKIL